MALSWSTLARGICYSPALHDIGWRSKARSGRSTRGFLPEKQWKLCFTAAATEYAVATQSGLVRWSMSTSVCKAMVTISWSPHQIVNKLPYIKMAWDIYVMEGLTTYNYVSSWLRWVSQGTLTKAHQLTQISWWQALEACPCTLRCTCQEA